jgi:hypothetical protein
MPSGGGTIPQGWARLRDERTEVVGSVGELTFWDPGLLRRTVWVVALALVPVGTAWLWWMLSRIVASARRDDPFNRDNARRLAAADIVVALGPLLAILVQQVVLRWMLPDSTAAGKADIWFRWESLPLWSLGVGLALLVLAAVWRHGLAMRRTSRGWCDAPGRARRGALPPRQGAH